MAEVVAAINEARAGFGLGPLAIDPDLTRVAQEWAENLAHRDEPLDDGSHGDFKGRIASVSPGSLRSGEDIAEGYPDAASVVTAWMKSPLHRANILGRFNKIGVGVEPSHSWNIFWVADFCLIPTDQSP